MDYQQWQSNFKSLFQRDIVRFNHDSPRLNMSLEPLHNFQAIYKKITSMPISKELHL